MVLRHRLPDGKTLFTSYKHIGEVYAKNGQEEAPYTKLADSTRRKKPGGLFDHLHKEVCKKFDDCGCTSWLTIMQTELNEYFTGLTAFIGQH